ncbi:unnamed protein product [Rotaria magnacalcarata]|nr:unnamed protein product [Rotaria magnacalcarata]
MKEQLVKDSHEESDDEEIDSDLRALEEDDEDIEAAVEELKVSRIVTSSRLKKSAEILKWARVYRISQLSKSNRIDFIHPLASINVTNHKENKYMRKRSSCQRHIRTRTLNNNPAKDHASSHFVENERYSPSNDKNQEAENLYREIKVPEQAARNFAIALGTARKPANL